ncbi:MAG: hypothetical protein EA405_13625 [Rhodospirillales bacterium]|nr:MAG: hypothetical protein EA405_13625 [Rhodospirillales bacterium]
MSYERSETEVSGIQTLSTSGVKMTVAPGRPVDLVRVGVVLTTATTDANTLITVQRRPVAGAAANEVTLMAFNVPVAAVGTVHYADIPTRAGVPVDPGADITVSSNGGSTAGAGHVFVEYFPRAFAGPRVASANKITVV